MVLNFNTANALRKAKSLPPGLDALYVRMMQDITKSEDADVCTQLLAVMMTVYRPLSVIECGTLMDDCHDLVDDPESVQEIVARCGSFLTIRHDTIYFLHQSAKDFLVAQHSGVIFPGGQPAVHVHVFTQSVAAMQRILKRDIYQLHIPGFLALEARPPCPDPLAPIRYSCIHWANHLVDARQSDVSYEHLTEAFLENACLYWIEALSLLRSVSAGMLGLRLVLQQEHLPRSALPVARDAYRLLQSFRLVIQECPLQTYAMALVFSPTKSLVRSKFPHDQPLWLSVPSRLPEQWSACEAILEGHTLDVHLSSFSPDGRQIISSTFVKRYNSGVVEATDSVKIWDATTGECEKTIEACAGAFSPDGQRILLACGSKIEIRNASSHASEAVLEAHDSQVNCVAFSADGLCIVSGSDDTTIKIWDARTGICEATMTEHSAGVTSVAFSPDGLRVVSVDYLPDSLFSTSTNRVTMMIWVARTGQVERKLEEVRCVAWSPDGQQLVVGGNDGAVRGHNIIRVECAETGRTLKKFKNESGRLNSVVFSPNGRCLASADASGLIRVWDLEAGTCTATFDGLGHAINSVAFSPDGQRIVSASWDKMVRVWDATIRTQQYLPEGHESSIATLAFSNDGTRVASASGDETIKVWSLATGRCTQTLRGHLAAVTTASFSPDGHRLVSASLNSSVRRVSSAAFSPDGQRVVSASWDKTVKIWNVSKSKCTATMALTGPSYAVRSAVFAANGDYIVAHSDGKAVLYNARTGKCIDVRLGVQGDTLSRVLLRDRGINPGDAKVEEDDTLVTEWAPFVSSWARYQDIGLSPDGCWLLRGPRRLLWLPPEYRKRPGQCFVIWTDEERASVALTITQDKREFPVFIQISL
ncbi:F-box and WD-40 domain protein 7 [Microdochium nivale]|nr:F-box and WD-40 domain protein 7 [Microdochium nivale]